MPRIGRGRSWLYLLPLSVVLAHASSARAADAEHIRRQLRVEPGATCLTAERLAAEVAQLLDDTPVADDFVFFVEGSASDPRNAYLRVVRQEGVVAQRAFEPGPARCNHLHAAVALAITFAIKAEPRAAPEVIRDWSLSGAGLWSYRLLPQFAPGVELSVRRALGEHVRVRAGALGAFAFGARLDSLPGTFDAALVAARADGCGRLELAPSLRGGACFGLLGGVLHVAGGELANAISSTVPWAALSGALDFEFELAARWSLLLDLSVTFLLHRVHVGFETTSGARGERQELDRFGLALGIGAAYYL
jgi:hypothetical protein